MAITYSKKDQGRTITVGTGTPASNSLTGIAGDMYVNSTDGSVYNYTTAWVTQSTWSAWSSKVAITIGAVTTPPTKATTKQNDYVQYRVNNNEVDSIYLYSATSGSGAADGSGNYLWTLPDSFQFDTTIYTVYTGSSVDLSGIYSLFGVIAGTFNSLDTYSSQVLVVPYNATQFRCLTCGTNYPKDYIGSGRFPMGNNNIVQALNFKFFKA